MYTKFTVFYPQVLSKDDKEIGKISKQWSGLAKEMFTDADNFGIQFPMDLDVKAKACLLGACLLIVSFVLMILYIRRFFKE